MGAKRGTPIERVLRRVERTEEGCWVFAGAQNLSGYGNVRVDHKTRLTHRVVYEALVGPIPDGLQLDHLCRNRACCNPEHLEPVTNRENGLRGESFAAANARKTTCPKGHPYSPRGDGYRYCRTCNRERVAARRVASPRPPARPPVTLLCEECRKPFEVDAHEAARGQRFCGKSCSSRVTMRRVHAERRAAKAAA